MPPPPQGLARLFHKPGPGIAAVIVLALSVLVVAYIYSFLGHFMVINLPPPDPVPQWAIDLARQSGMSIPTPTPAPDHLLMSEILASSGRLGLYLLIVGGTVFICWPIIALGLHLLARLAGGKGSYGEMLAAIGYTYVPKVIGMFLVVLVVAMLPVYSIDYANYHDESDLLRYMDASSIPFWLITGITHAGLILSCGLGVMAVRQVEKVSWTAAALIVGIPLVLYFLF